MNVIELYSKNQSKELQPKNDDKDNSDFLLKKREVDKLEDDSKLREPGNSNVEDEQYLCSD